MGGWGIFSAVSKLYVFGIYEPSKRKAYQALFNKIGKDAYKWRFEARKIKVHPNEMYKNKPKQKRRDSIMAVTNSDTKVITGKVRLSFANIWEPKSINGGDAKYSASILIPKTDKNTMKKIKAAVEAAKELGKNEKWGGKIPKNIHTPVRDGDEEADEKGEAYEDHYFFNASSKNKPGIVDRNRDEIIDTTEVYSGCYVRVSVNFYPFDTNGNKGVAVGLNNIQKWEDGDFLGGRSRAEDDFDDLDGDDGEEDDDFLN